MRILLPGCALLALILSGCASVPPASVELSATIGRDLTTVHTANRALAQLYFDGIAERIDRFVDSEYRPFVLHHMLQDPDLTAALAAALADTGSLPLHDLLSIIVEESIASIEAFRAELQDPVHQQRQHVLRSIDLAFQQLQTANAVVTGHLASVRKVHDVQAQTLAAAGLEDLRQGWPQRLAAVSDGLDRVLSVARDGSAFAGLPAQVRHIVHPLAGGPAHAQEP